MAELVTAKKYKLPIKVVVIKNNVLGQIKWEQVAFLGNPDFGIDLEPIDFVQVATACGVAGFHVERPDQVEATLRQALDTPGPALVEAVVDPLEPPLPGHISMEQARHVAAAILRGEPDSWKILKNVLRDTVPSMV
jgi:pyruvate dehydrogenase (quinone)